MAKRASPKCWQISPYQTLFLNRGWNSNSTCCLLIMGGCWSSVFMMTLRAFVCFTVKWQSVIKCKWTERHCDMKMPLPWFSSPSSQKNKAQERITLQRNRIFAKKEANKKQFWTKLLGCSCCCIGKDIDNTSREPPKDDQTLTTLSFNLWMKLHHQTHLFVAHLPCPCWTYVFCHSWPWNPCANAYFPFVNGRCHLKGSMPFFSSELHSGISCKNSKGCECWELYLAVHMS